MEADYDRAIKENQSRDDISVRWDWGLNSKRVAYFYFPRDDNELKLMQAREGAGRGAGPGMGRGPGGGGGQVKRARGAAGNRADSVCGAGRRRERGVIG